MSTNANIENIVTTLVRVKLSVGGNTSGEIKARELAKESAQLHGAQEADISSSVKWLPKERRTLLSGASSSLRGGFNTRTLPWEDGGYRVVPADRYLDLLTFVSDAKTRFDNVVNDIAANWDDIIVDAKRRLNGALNKVTLPSKDQFIAGFRVDISSSSVVATNDIRITGLDEIALSRIREQSKREYADRIENGVFTLAQQLTDVMSDLTERLNKPNQKGIRYEGWNVWAKKTVSAIRPLNISNDKRLDAMLDHVEKIIAKVKADELRESDDARKQVKQLINKTSKAVDPLDLFGV